MTDFQLSPFLGWSYSVLKKVLDGIGNAGSSDQSHSVFVMQSSLWLKENVERNAERLKCSKYSNLVLFEST